MFIYQQKVYQMKTQVIKVKAHVNYKSIKVMVNNKYE